MASETRLVDEFLPLVLLELPGLLVDKRASSLRTECPKSFLTEQLYMLAELVRFLCCLER